MRANTPMLRQYFDTKAAHPGVLLAMRVGDFYEFYGEDAETAAAALEITLTGRDDGNQRMPMAGVPYHAVERYMARLLHKGFKVALCDQIEDPKQAKGLVRRAVTRVLTPGTVLEDSMLSAGQSNFLAAISMIDGRAGLAILDPSTGEFLATEICGDGLEERILQEVARIRPSELLVSDPSGPLGEIAKSGLDVAVSEWNALSFDRAESNLLEQLDVASLSGFGVSDKPTAVLAASMVIAYAQKNGLTLTHVTSISSYSVDGFMNLDMATRRSLELTQSLSDGSKNYTLFSVLDETVTAMGTRLLRRWIDQPLLDVEALRERQDAIERLASQTLVRGDLRDLLRRVSDLERLTARASAGIASPRDLAALRDALRVLPEVQEPLRNVTFGRIEKLRFSLGDHFELTKHLQNAIVSEPPHQLKEGGVIAEGYDIELDKLRELRHNGRKYIAALEAAERERTGISNLKVGYNAVFGYYLEVQKAHLDKVPAEYIRKQTVANAERYITAELKEHESAVLGAEQKAVQLESEIFTRIRSIVAESAASLLQTARAIAELDVLASLAEVAVRRRFVKPEFVESTELTIHDGRHPVVELQSGPFVPNDLSLCDALGTSLVVLTGPNMSGKSTFLRQTALIVLLAQIGSFVPAAKCRLGLVDRIFARIGAKDEIALGQSTFMVEMVESANILNNATQQSLVILDEVGRGTSTYDGLAIAWAMTERLAVIGAKTLFATHYHQLNALADDVPNIANFRVSVEEVGEDIVWTHRVLPGGTDRSYGLHVARMAGIPRTVLERATQILTTLEGGEVLIPASVNRLQLSLFEPETPEVVKALVELDIEAMTPIQALQLLDKWKSKFAKS